MRQTNTCGTRKGDERIIIKVRTFKRQAHDTYKCGDWDGEARGHERLEGNYCEVMGVK
jgi:hypothetical protein